MLKLPIIWPSDSKSWLTGKDPDAGKDWGQEEPGATEDEMVGWHHQLDGHELEQTLGDSEGQGGLTCCTPWRSQRFGHDWATEQEQKLVMLAYLLVQFFGVFFFFGPSEVPLLKAPVVKYIPNSGINELPLSMIKMLTVSRSVMSDSLQFHGLLFTWLLCP